MTRRTFGVLGVELQVDVVERGVRRVGDDRRLLLLRRTLERVAHAEQPGRDDGTRGAPPEPVDGPFPRRFDGFVGLAVGVVVAIDLGLVVHSPTLGPAPHTFGAWRSSGSNWW